MKLVRQILLPVLLVVLVGCAPGTSGTRDESGVGSEPIGAGSSSGSGEDSMRSGSAMDDGAGGGSGGTKIIYFGFDQSDISSEYMDVLAGHARYLASNPGVDVRLEGHADERGSREYNIGLGDRRAQAVREVLLLRGVSARNMKAISFGEERPAVMGSNEESWAQNRRVELVFSE